jgi:hypothetical protein
VQKKSEINIYLTNHTKKEKVNVSLCAAQCFYDKVESQMEYQRKNKKNCDEILNLIENA